MKKTMLMVAMVGVMAWTAQGALVQSNDSHYSSWDFFPASSTDLINAGQSSLSSVSGAGLSYGSLDQLNNGTSGDYWGAGADWGTWTVAFNLNTSLNPLGYNVSEIATFASWNDSRANQTITVEYLPVGQSEYLTLGTYSNNMATGGDFCTRIKLSDSQGANILTGIQAIRFGISAYTLMKEIDVAGSPVPEPVSLVLLGVGSLMLRRKK